MRKRGAYISIFVSGALAVCGLVVFGGSVFAVQKCFTDSTTGSISCNDSVRASVTVTPSCSIARPSDGGSGDYVKTLVGGTTEDIPGSKFKVMCNDLDGFAIYAIGFSGNELGNTDLVAQNISTDNNIKTDGVSSNWKMRVSSVSGSFAPSIENSFDSYHNIPSEYVKVASYDSLTFDDIDTTTGSSITTSYQATASSDQAAGSYVGQVKYVLVHPGAAQAPVDADSIRITFYGAGLYFDENDTVATNTVTYKHTCVDGGSCSFSAVNGEYAEPNDFESYWVYGGTSFGPISGANSFLDFLNANGSDLLGQNVQIFAKNSSAAILTFHGNGLKYDDGTTMNTVAYEWSSADNSFVNVGGSYKNPIGFSGTWNLGSLQVDIQNEPTLIQTLNFAKLSGGDFSGSVLKLDATSRRINYNGNGASGGSMSSIIVDDDEIGLIAPNYYKSGYGFAGWSENSSATVNSSDITYGPNEIVSPYKLNFVNGVATLYAVWVQSAGTMQGWNGCSAMHIGDVTALTDNRDNNVYTVAKLNDGNCWMVENLRLDSSATLTSANTNNPLISQLLPTSSNWCTSDDSQCIDQAMLNTDNTVQNQTPTTEENSNIYGYGNYYNWYSATAGNGTYSTGTGESVSGDICPAGWRLPMSGLNGDFIELNNTINVDGGSSSAGFLAYPTNFVLPGYKLGSYIGPRGFEYGSGRYWTNTSSAYDSGGAYIFYVGGSAVQFETAMTKYNGINVRCVYNR